MNNNEREMTNTYCAQIINIGKHATDFFEEKMLITFKKGVPDELAEYCFMLSDDLCIASPLIADQKISIGKYSYTITAIGKIAIKNFKELGHITLIFDGGTVPKLDGAMHLSGQLPLELNIGDKIVIEK